MSFDIKYHTSADLQSKRKELAHRLTDSYSSVEGAPITLRDLRDLASMGCLSDSERDLYDELRRVEMMLGVDESPKPAKSL